MTFICMKMSLYAGHIFMWMVSYIKDLFWHRDTGKAEMAYRQVAYTHPKGKQENPPT